MSIQVTLMTGHKGVDLHAETAGRVIRTNLEGGEDLLSLHRAEYHTFWREDGAEAPESVERLLGVGRFFNPNKHHYAHLEHHGAHAPWYAADAAARGEALAEGWPGEVVETDLPAGDDVVTRLLGGPAPEGAGVVHVVTFPLGEEGPLLSGVIWRFVLAPGAADPLAAAEKLAVARSAREGLLVNPHMQGWRTALRT